MQRLWHACVGMHILVRHKHISLPHGPIQPSSPSAKELHDIGIKCRLSYIGNLQCSDTPSDDHKYFIQSCKMYPKLAYSSRVPQQLCGFICAFHPAAPGSNPKHTNYAFINLNWDMMKRRKQTEKGRDFPDLKKVCALFMFLRCTRLNIVIWMKIRRQFVVLLQLRSSAKNRDFASEDVN